ncbi:MAG TPA: hypothetical protein VNA22_05240 [Pyrinomonadaceae bacterium]|nr:hypothetical protein [Pyrinomonadaceae bacterium]
MFTRSTKTCPLRSECASEAKPPEKESVLDQDWEVFVIRRDAGKEAFDWFTVCCEEPKGNA